jgi:hypothetical protein
MPISVFKYKIANLTDSVLNLIKGSAPKRVQNRVKRLINDGTARDLIFVQGVATGIQLTKLDKKSVKGIADILRKGVKREDDGKDKILEQGEIDEIDELLKGKFNLNARKRICNTLSNADAMMLEEFIGLIE